MPGQDMILNELLKALNLTNKWTLLQILNQVLAHQQVPASWKTSNIKILAKKLTKYFEGNNYLSPTQAGFWKGFSSHSHIFTMELYNGSKAQVLTPYGPTTHFTISRGVQQGDPLSHILFIFLNPLLTKLHKQKDIGFTSLKQSQTNLLLRISICWAKLRHKCKIHLPLLSSSVMAMECSSTLDLHVHPLQNKLNKFESRISMLCRRQLSLSTFCKLTHRYGLQAVVYMT